MKKLIYSLQKMFPAVTITFKDYFLFKHFKRPI